MLKEQHHQGEAQSDLVPNHSSLPSLKLGENYEVLAMHLLRLGPARRTPDQQISNSLLLNGSMKMRRWGSCSI
jgi:hypothetical protein